MSKIKYTKEQSEAINTLDKSVLVAAAAGSGKTAVLIQRILNIVLSGEADVDQMLVVTFTRAAASEMKLKLSKEIKKRLQGNISNEERAKLKLQLDKLSNAYISTFNSFEVRLLKEFFFELDVEPNFSVCDDVQSTMLQVQAIDELFDELFEDDEMIKGGSFRQFLRLYSSEKSESAIKEQILKSYSKLRSLPNYIDWAKDKAKTLLMTKEEFFSSQIADIFTKELLADIDESIEYFTKFRDIHYENAFAEHYDSYLADEIPSLLALKEKIENCGFSEEAIDILSDFSFARTKAVRDSKTDEDKHEKYLSYQDIKDEITSVRKNGKDLITSWSSKYPKDEFDLLFDEMNKTYAYTLYFINLIEAFEKKYQEKKHDDKLLDFGDMDHYSAKLLQKEEIRERLRGRFEFIFIDEYQDTNGIQEYLISQIAREDNVFKVGDVKQSIYGFREAEPEIFENTYKEYGSSSNENAKVIDLNSNFRSNLGTINYINKVFSQIMEGYDDKAALHKGGEPWDDDLSKYDFIPDVYILEDGINKKNPSEDSDDSSNSNSNEADDVIEELSKNEAEAKEVARIVNSIIGTTFYDSATGEVREAEPRDIVILLRGIKSSGSDYMSALKAENVDAHIEEGENLFDTTEIRVAISLLETIDNPRRDIPLIATLHSEVFDFKSSELATIKAEHKDFINNGGGASDRRYHYWQALDWYQKNGSDEELRKKIEGAYKRISDWKRMSLVLPVHEFIWNVLVDSGYYMYAGAMYDGNRRQMNLRTLVDKAQKLSLTSVITLNTYINYLNVLRKKKIKNGQVGISGKDDNLVKIMTIHKSKGLEYPFVIVAGLGKRLSYDKKETGLTYDSKIGLGLDFVAEDKTYKRSTLIKDAIAIKSKTDAYKEELRILYVAMTRARNKLILVGTTKSVDKLLEGKGRASYFEIMGGSLQTLYNYIHIKQIDKSVIETERSNIKRIFESKINPKKASEKAVYDEVSRRLAFDYPHKDELSIKAKYSVSEIRKGVVLKSEELRPKMRFNIKKTQRISAQVGTAYHRLAEFIDFKEATAGGSVNINYIKEKFDHLVSTSVIDEDIAPKIDVSHIAKFLESDLGKRAVAAANDGSLQKEKPFTMKHDLEGHEVLVQGVIDCCFEEDGEIVILDYKSSHIDENNNLEESLAQIKEDYAIQLDLYARAAELGTGKKVKAKYLYLFAIDECLEL